MTFFTNRGEGEFGKGRPIALCHRGSRLRRVVSVAIKQRDTNHSVIVDANHFGGCGGTDDLGINPGRRSEADFGIFRPQKLKGDLPEPARTVIA